jgi:hypothetical protein
LVTASASGNIITFTKGNTSTFSVTVDTGSAATTIFEVVFTGENITKGDPLYISGSQGANPRVFKADASNPAKMPVTFVSNETIGVSNTTNAIVLGLIEGIDLTGYVAGQTIYVAEGGGWSASLPSGSNSITQLLGVVTKGGSGGKGLVLNPGPAQLPGLDTGKMWIGNGNNQPIEITTASFVNTASFNSYTSSTNSRLTNIESTTASLLIETQNLELFSASALISINSLNGFTSSQNILNGTFATTASFNSYTSSNDQRVSSLEINSASVNVSIINLNTTTASLLVDIDNLELFSASALTSISNLNSATSSLFTSASLGLTTASFSGNTLTFTKGDNSTFNVVIPDVSGSAGDFVTTSSFNEYTSSNDQKVNTLISATGSYATTGSNSFNGNQIITGSITTSEDITVNSVQFGFGNSGGTSSIAIGNLALSNNTAVNNVAIGPLTLQQNTTGAEQVAIGESALRENTTGNYNTAFGASAGKANQTGNENTFIGWYAGFNAGNVSQNVVIGARAGTSIKNSSNTLIGHSAGAAIDSGSNNTIIGQSAGAQVNGGSGNTFIGVASGFNVSGSNNTFIGTYRGIGNESSVIALSDGAQNLRAIYNNGWLFTGSVTITGDQTFVDAAGNSVTLSDTSGSLMLVAKTFTSASAHLSASAGNQVNLIFKNNNNTGDTIISGSNNIFVNPAASTAGFKRYIGGSNNIFNTTSLPLISGSMAFSPSMGGNIGTGTYTFRGPVNSSAWNINNNLNIGTVLVGQTAANNAEKLVSGLTMTTNIIPGTISIIANGAPLSSSMTIVSNFVAGGVTINASSSSVSMVNNIINDPVFVLTNNYFSSSVGLGNVTASRNNIGGQSNQIIVAGALPAGTTTATSFSDNFMGGGSNTIYGDIANARVSGSSAYHNAIRNIVFGNGLIITGSSLLTDNSSYGSAFFGRYNAIDGTKDLTNEVIFAVGTGNTTTRKTGFLIDSGSNTFIEGTLNVSGSTTVTGSLNVSNVLQLTGLDPLPTGADGQLAVSASNLYFYSGSAWNKIAFG